MITIYGKKDCAKCLKAKTVIPEAVYLDIADIYTDIPMNEANDIITASNGHLPIILIDTEFGTLQLSVDK